MKIKFVKLILVAQRLIIFVTAVKDSSNCTNNLKIFNNIYFCGDLLNITSNVTDYTHCVDLCATKYEKCVSINYSNHTCELMKDTGDLNVNKDSFINLDGSTFASFNCNEDVPSTIIKRQIIPGQCGRSSVLARKSLARIVGGYEAKPNSFPWAVGLFLQKQHYCGGTLISVGHKTHSNMVITAAHCVSSFTNQPFNIVMKFGCTDISSKSCVTVVAEKIEVHPNFDMVTALNDIALITMETPVSFDKMIQPICLPSVKDLLLTTPGKFLTVVGWGSVSESGPKSNHLLQVDVPLLDMELCNSKKFYNGKLDADSMMCAGYAEGKKDSCQGDSGGPLMVKRDGVYFLVGIVSFGEGCARPNFPGIYTRVETFTSWIEEKIKVNGTKTQ